MELNCELSTEQMETPEDWKPRDPNDQNMRLPTRTVRSRKARDARKICAKFGSGSRFGVGIMLERSCVSGCPHCEGDAFHRSCRFFDFKPHYEVKLERKINKPLQNVRALLYLLPTRLTSVIRARTTLMAASALTSFTCPSHSPRRCKAGPTSTAASTSPRPCLLTSGRGGRCSMASLFLFAKAAGTSTSDPFHRNSGST